MMNEDKTIFETGGTIELGGRTLTISRLRKVDSDDYLDWLRAELRRRSCVIETVKASLDGLGPEDRQYLLRQALEETRREVQPDSPLAREVRGSTASVARMIYLQARRKHPDLQIEWVEQQVAQADLDDLVEKLNLMAGGGAKNLRTPETEASPTLGNGGMSA